jgi:hypothetical protein
MAGKIIADTIQTESSFLQMNVSNTRVATINASGIYSNTGGKIIGSDGTFGNSTIVNATVSSNLNFDSTGTTGFNTATANTVRVHTAGVEAVRVTSGGDVGIGTTSPTNKLTVTDSVSSIVAINATTRGGVVRAQQNGTTLAHYGVSGTFLGDTSADAMVAATNNVVFYTNNSGTERMRIDANGNLLVGVTSPLVTSCHSFVNNTAAGNSPQLIVRNAQNTAGRYWKIGATADANPYMIIYNAADAGVYMGYGSTSFSSSSDETLKDIIEPITDGLNKVVGLRTVIGKFKSDEEETRRAFLIAQDVQEVLPEAITTDPNGKLGLQYQDMIPLLVNAIKELKEIVDAQAVEIAALKAK